MLHCSFPKKQRCGWVVTPIEKEVQEEVCAEEKETKRYRVEPTNNTYAENRPDWEYIKTTFGNIYNAVIEYRDNVYQQLLEIESELCDCEHACEFFKYNAAKGYQMYSMIRDRRIKRRCLKDEYRRASAVLNMSYQNIAEGELDRIFHEIDQQAYEPRALTELFI